MRAVVAITESWVVVVEPQSNPAAPAGVREVTCLMRGGERPPTRPPRCQMRWRLVCRLGRAWMVLAPESAETLQRLECVFVGTRFAVMRVQQLEHAVLPLDTPWPAAAPGLALASAPGHDRSSLRSVAACPYRSYAAHHVRGGARGKFWASSRSV